MAHPDLLRHLILLGQVEPALGKDEVDDRLVNRCGRLRRVQRGSPLQHVLLGVGSEEPLVERALDVERVLLGRVRGFDALLDGDEAEGLAEVGAVGVREVHQDAVGEEHEPEVAQARLLDAPRVNGVLLFEKPAVSDVGDFLLQHDDFLQAQMPQRQLLVARPLDLEGFVASLDDQHLVNAVVLEIERLRNARVDLARVLGW